MTIRNLDLLLHPHSVAIVGASTHAGTAGQRVLENVLSSGFDGPVFAVNPHRVEMDDEWWVPSVADLPMTPDLAIIATPAATVPGVIAELGAKGTKLAVVISAGFHDPAMRQAILDAARPHMLRIVGPNCLGVILPHAGLNGSFAQANAEKGGLAMISQSGALVTSMIDWANDRGVGFSGIVSIGDKADVDFADLIDLFAADPKTDAIALYIESITKPAKFLTAARAAARIKPVIALKAGRSAAAGAAAMSHTGAIVGAYDVYATAFRRAGITLVESLTDLFDATQVLAKRQPFLGKRLAIVTNGGGTGILATDAMEKIDGEMAKLDPATIAKLDEQLPKGWSRANPVDVVGDAHADRFSIALDAVGKDPNVDAILVMHCPTAVETGTAIARGVVGKLRSADYARVKPVIACWLGTRNPDAARPIFREAGIPMFDNVDDAVQGFGYLLKAREARDTLMRAPAHRSVPEGDRARAEAVIEAARKQGRTTLSASEARDVLAAYGVPVVASRVVDSADAVEGACRALKAPYAVKIVSPEITHKSDAGGVALHLADPEAAGEAAHAMEKRIRQSHPEATIAGFEIEPMIDSAGKYELLVGLADDPTFGPVLAFGAGGKSVEVVKDRALGLPPLDDALALEMIEGTRIAKLLAGYRDEPAADVAGVVRVLNAVSAIAADLPDVAELDINPLIAGHDGVLAIDARIRITKEPAQSRMVIRAVPTEWTADLVTRSGVKLHIRPVVPTDEDALADFFRHVSREDIRFRFLTALKDVGHERLAAMTQIDYRRTMNFLAFNEEGTLIATAMLASEPDKSRAELAISVHRDWKGKGVSWTLMQYALRYAEAEGIEAVESLESSENYAALALEREMGFTTEPCPDSPTETLVRKVLTKH